MICLEVQRKLLLVTGPERNIIEGHIIHLHLAYQVKPAVNGETYPQLQY